MKIVYWSGSGNTEKMANLIAQGIKENGVEAQVIDVSHANSDIFNDEDIIILGCPAMGAEMLEESEFEPFIESISSKVSGKKAVPVSYTHLDVYKRQLQIQLNRL